MIKRILYSVAVISGICLLALSVIAYSRGYRFDPRHKILATTGILSASSYPEGSAILINGKFVSATNTSLSLPPDWYDVKIEKTGYQPWQKKVKVQGEVVSKVDALLIPSNPSLRAITLTGISSPVLSPDNSKIAYIIPTDEATTSATIQNKVGVWILELRNSAIGTSPQPRQIYQASARVDLTNTDIIWSADEKELLLLIKSTQGKKEIVSSALKIPLEGNTVATEVSRTYETILDLWGKLKQEQEEILLISIPLPISHVIKNATQAIKFSPDETKIFYQATKSGTLARVIDPPLIGSNSTQEYRDIKTGTYYVYDIKEDKNFEITNEEEFPSPNALFWYTDSKHIVLIEKETISIIDYDGTNKRAAYQGPFENGYVFPWSSGNKLVILTRLTKSSTLPTLYEIDLR